LQNFKNYNNNRMAKKLILIGLTLLTGISTKYAAAQTSAIGSSFVTTAVPFLRISPDARAGAMGDAGIAVSPDPNAQYWNVAKIPFTDKNYGYRQLIHHG
jgi:hypothetical protein